MIGVKLIPQMTLSRKKGDFHSNAVCMVREFLGKNLKPSVSRLLSYKYTHAFLAVTQHKKQKTNTFSDGDLEQQSIFRLVHVAHRRMNIGELDLSLLDYPLL